MFGAKTVNAAPDIIILCTACLLRPRSPQISDLSEHNYVVRIEGCVVRIEGGVVKKCKTVVKTGKTVVKNKQFIKVHQPLHSSTPLVNPRRVLKPVARALQHSVDRLSSSAGSIIATHWESFEVWPTGPDAARVRSPSHSVSPPSMLGFHAPTPSQGSLVWPRRPVADTTAALALSLVAADSPANAASPRHTDGDS